MMYPTLRDAAAKESRRSQLVTDIVELDLGELHPIWALIFCGKRDDINVL